MHKFFFKEFAVEHIVKPKLKNSYLSIDKALHIVVKTPQVSHQFVEQLLLQKEPWLRKQYAKVLQNQPQTIQLTQELLLFGEVVDIREETARFLHKKLEKVDLSDTKKVLHTYDSFYKHIAQKYFPQRVEYFSSRMNLSFTKIKYRKMKSRWGSCNMQKELTFNTQLIKVKKELIDYVIVHELAHIKHMNHSKAFHALVDSYLPDAKLHREALKNIYFK